MEYFRAGHKAGFSGVYKVVNKKDHIPPLTAPYGQLFPSVLNEMHKPGPV